MTFGFRVARPAAAAWNVSKTALQIGAFWGLLLFVVPAWIARLEGAPRYDVPRVLAGALFAAAGCVGLWSGWTMAVRGRGTPLPVDCPARLGVPGPAAAVRDPVAVAGLTQGVAAALWLGSFWVLAYTAAGGVFWNWVVRPLEERDLEKRFGASYDAYRRAVKCWVPRRRAYR